MGEPVRYSVTHGRKVWMGEICGAKFTAMLDPDAVRQQARCPACGGLRYLVVKGGAMYIADPRDANEPHRVVGYGDFRRDDGYAATGVCWVDSWKVTRIQWELPRSGTPTRCGAKCMGAKGPKCDCECRAANHGAGCETRQEVTP